MNCADCKISTYCEVITLCPLHAAAQDLLEACKLALAAFEHNDAIDWNVLAESIAKAESK